jgi:hypothetical protein
MRSHAVVWRRRSRTIRSTHARVVLRAAPRKADARVSNRISLHLVYCHFSGVTVHKLNEATPLSRRNLNVCYLAESLEERTQLVLGHITRETADKHGGVVRVSELVHGSLAHASTRIAAATAAVEWTRLRHAPTHAGLHGIRHHWTTVAATVVGVLVPTATRCQGRVSAIMDKGITYRCLGVAVLMRIGRLPQYTPCISCSARCWSLSSAKRTNP